MTSFVRAIYDFKGEPNSSEISMTTGEILSVTRTDVGEGWWEGENSNGKIGLFPAAYVEVLSATELHKYTKKSDSIDTLQERYDLAVEEADGDDWEDDWDEENDTYSEIAPSGAASKTHFNVPVHSSSNYDNKNLPATPSEDVGALSAGPPNPTTLRKSGMFGKSSDSYILGLGNKEKIPETEIIYIVQKDNFYEWQSNNQPYSVVVASPKKESKFKGMKTFIAYQLTPTFNNISVSRRYKHFDWLHGRLVEKFCLIPIPPLPDKQVSGRYEEQFVEHRRVQLQEFVDWVCRHPVLSNCEVWYHFLTCTDDKMWKLGKRKAEKDIFVGVTYCWAISPPEKQLLQSNVDSQIDNCATFTHALDTSVRNLLTIATENTKRCQTQSKKDFQRIGDGLSDIAKALNIDERRFPNKSIDSLSEIVGKIGGIYIGIGQLFGDQPKFDWIPLSDSCHIYRGILSSFPDILSTHKGAMQKRKECERLASEQKMSNTQIVDINRRCDVISYAVMAEISHFKFERDSHLKQALKSFIEEQIKFYTNVVSKLQEAYKQFS